MAHASSSWRANRPRIRTPARQRVVPMGVLKDQAKGTGIREADEKSPLNPSPHLPSQQRPLLVGAPGLLAVHNQQRLAFERAVCLLLLYHGRFWNGQPSYDHRTPQASTKSSAASLLVLTSCFIPRSMCISHVHKKTSHFSCQRNGRRFKPRVRRLSLCAYVKT